MTEQQKSLVYGVYGEDDLVFFPKQRAQELAQLRKAVNSVTTWGEFKASVSEQEYRRAVELLREEMEDDGFIPDAAAPFDEEDIPGFGDGDWPPFPAREMLYWVPYNIQSEFERPGYSTVNDVLVLSASDMDAIIKAFEAHGYQCSRDDDLVKVASGLD